jgi:hypothetical protein
MRFSFVPAAFAISIMLVGTASASTIYKSIDADGNVFFTDKPISDSSERLEIISRPTNNAGIQAQVQARLQHQATAAEAAANAPAGPTEDEKRDEARERAEKCSMYKERQVRFTRSRRIYREDSDGERVYLDEQEMGEVRANVEDQIEEYCS